VNTSSGPVVVFRADASVAIGGGHVVRCLALANALQDVGMTCWFAGLAETLATVPELARSGHHWIEVSAPGNATAMLHAIAAGGPSSCDWLIVDHYRWDAAEESRCRTWARNILVIDDLADRSHDCDLLLDQTYGRTVAEYGGLVPSGCEMLTGTSCALLRPEFAAARPASLKRRCDGRLDRVLITMGLTDPVGATPVLVKQLLNSGMPLKIDVVLGMSAPYLDEVRQIASANEGALAVHAGTSAMAELMSNADIAFGAAGSTSWERCCVGLPSALLVLADNQQEIAERLAAASAAIHLGRFEDIEPMAVARVLSDLRRSPRRLVEMARSAAAVCDGRGIRRVGMRLQPEHSRDGSPVWLRPVTAEDVDLLRQLQSEDGARQFMRNPLVPSPEEHQAWLAQRLADPDCLFSIVTCDGEPAGSLRLDQVETGSFEISITIGSAFRGRGIGLAALALARRLVPEAELRAEVIAGNMGSEALFTAAGFTPTGYGWRRLPALLARGDPMGGQRQTFRAHS
jgi:UDP-2,4-diacetamido-2,4,6-trideoxy-beta-L-altropyranose hydrolase